MRNIKKLLTLTSLFLVLFSFPVSATAATDSEKFQFQLDISSADELLPGDISEHILLVQNHTDRRLAYMVETVTFTGSEALAEELELSLLDGEASFLHGTVAALSRTDSFEVILTHPAGRDKYLTLRLYLRKEATNTVAGDTLTLSICLSGTDAPLQLRPPEETEKPPETPAETQRPPGTRMDQLMEWIDRIYEHPENLVETAARPYGDGGKLSSGHREYTEETRRKTAGAGAKRDFSAAKSAGEKENEKKNSTTNDGGNARLALRIRDVSPRHASVQISTEGGSGTIQDPITLYIGPTQREKALLVTCLFLFILLLILIIIKCWLLYRATQSETQEGREYASTEQGV